MGKGSHRQAYVFGHVKFFDSTLPHDHEKNYYMEREWRIIGSMEFGLEDVAGVILPAGYAERFKCEFPALSNRVTASEDPKYFV